MTWEELRQLAIDEIESALVYLDLIVYKGYFFWSNGRVETSTETILKERTYEQMYEIIKELED